MTQDFNEENLFGYLPLPDGGHHDELASFIKQNDRGNIQLLLAFAPKMGGTFLRTAFQHLARTKGMHARLSRGSWASSDQIRDIYFPVVANQHLSRFEGHDAALHVHHLHLLANKPNQRLIELFNIQTLIMKRNLLDAMASFYGDREKDTLRPSQDPILNLGNAYKALDPDRKRKAIIAFTLPWYLQCFITWREYTNYCENEGLQKPCWISFNDLKDNPVQLIMKITKTLDLKLNVTETDIEQALEKTFDQKDETTRFNKGVNGRGLEFFNKDEQDEINRIIDLVGRDAIEAEGLLGYP